MFGMAFMDPDIVLPGFVHRLTGSAIMVGMVSAIVKAGWFWPQMIVSNFIEHRPRKMPVYALSAVVRLISLLLLALLLFLVGDTQPRFLFPVFLLLLACNVSFSGVAGIPFMDIVAKTVSAERYGILFGSRRFLGGVLACGAGFVVRSILSERSRLDFPQNYALLFLFSTVLTAVACALFVLVKEPVESEPGTRSPFVKHMMRAPAILKHDLDYRRLFLIRMLTSFSGMAAPFYVPFAIHKLGVGYETTGTFLAAGMGGVILGTVLWSYISYRYGSPTLFLVSGLGGLFPPVIALTTSLLAASTSVSHAHLVVPYYFVFACATAAATGFGIAGSAYLLELAPRQIRPTYVGFMNTLTFPFMFSSVLAGILIRLVSYEFAFVLCLVAGIFLIREARKISPAAANQPLY